MCGQLQPCRSLVTLTAYLHAVSTQDSSHPGQPVSKKVKAKRSKKEKRRKKSDKGQEGTEQIRMKEEEEEEREGEEEERATESEGKISTKTTPIGTTRPHPHITLHIVQFISLQGDSSL